MDGEQELHNIKDHTVFARGKKKLSLQLISRYIHFNSKNQIYHEKT